MTVRASTYALARSIPYLLQQGAAQDVEAPIRHGTDGSLVTPSAATLSVMRPDDTTFSSGPADTTSGVATYTIPDTSAEDVGRDWELAWAHTIGGVVYPYRMTAYLCQYVPPCPVTVLDLYDRVPELEGRIPARQGVNGTGEGWQTQIDDAYREFLRSLIADARPIWLLRSAEDYFDAVRLRACELAVKAVPSPPESAWTQTAKVLYLEAQAARGKVRLSYTDERESLRRAGQATVRLAPVGRPSW